MILFIYLLTKNFEAITPNVLAQGIETVRGGGLIIFLMESVNTLQELLNVKMVMQFID